MDKDNKISIGGDGIVNVTPNGNFKLEKKFVEISAFKGNYLSEKYSPSKEFNK